jgi:RNA polymerase sigma factor (sigma-70 family)
MVLRVCRQALGDDHDARDAAQAVFLVLARKAGSIRSRGSVAPWLYGVARRVAAKARRREGVRRATEARTVEAVVRKRGTVAEPQAVEDWEVIHEEVARLPEKYRAPVVLCYLEGQTYDEAARRIGCPVGTVRVRLSRARDTLRDRLTRRGFAPTALAALDRLTEGPGVAVSLSPAWSEATVKASVAFGAGRAVVAGVVSVSALTLSQGVMRAMLISHLKVMAIGLMTAGVVATGVGVIVGQEPGSKPAAPSQTRPAVLPNPKPVDEKELSRLEAELQAKILEQSIRLDKEIELTSRILEAARRRLEAQTKFYEEGRITIDRYLDASEQVRVAEGLVAKTREARIAAAQAHLDRVKSVMEREKAELDVGRGTVADVAEAQHRSDLAELELLQAQEPPKSEETAILEKRVDALEKKLDRVLKLLDGAGILSTPQKAAGARR